MYSAVAVPVPATGPMRTTSPGSSGGETGRSGSADADASPNSSATTSVAAVTNTATSRTRVSRPAPPGATEPQSSQGSQWHRARVATGQLRPGRRWRTQPRAGPRRHRDGHARRLAGGRRALPTRARGTVAVTIAALITIPLSAAISVTVPITSMITASAPIAVAVPVSATALHAAFGPTSKDHHRRAVAVLTMAMGMRTHHQAGAKGRRQHARGTGRHRRYGQHLADVASLLRWRRLRGNRRHGGNRFGWVFGFFWIGHAPRMTR
ncbi:Uncharacterised protein [Mycobacteroides abscessus subsp. abscessus]|nr:Uncharacterised protein [Mycobacteroides abscessus subsp. abscessus]